ncbi:MAG: CoA transferase [Betaproteobacteria bacterium]|nr:CoA transferase [Betaproteobacteria bacterium]
MDSISNTVRDPLLKGVTVLDFTRVLSGPYCTRLLADLGADVIKIERPGEGDEIRYTVLQLDPGRTDQSTYYVRLNAGKRSIALDLAHPDSRAVILDLVQRSDVVVENFSPGVMARYGIDAAALHEIKPSLICCSISGFGQTGPLRSMQAYAHLINAISGMMDLDRCGDPHPRVSYLQAADVLAGAHAFGAICAALFARPARAKGAFIDVDARMPDRGRRHHLRRPVERWSGGTRTAPRHDRPRIPRQEHRHADRRRPAPVVAARGGDGKDRTWKRTIGSLPPPHAAPTGRP